MKEQLTSFAVDAVLAHMTDRLPPVFHRDYDDTTRQAVRELLAETDITTVSLSDLHRMATELIDDWKEYQDDRNV